MIQDESCFYLMIGVLRKVSRLTAEKQLSLDDALTLIANEIEDGITAFHEGKARPLTYEDMKNGKFMGDMKSPVTPSATTKKST